jgi:hypothetical protein
MGIRLTARGVELKEGSMQKERRTKYEGGRRLANGDRNSNKLQSIVV